MKAILFLSFLFISTASNAGFINITGDATPFGDTLGVCDDEICYVKSSPGYYTTDGEVYLY